MVMISYSLQELKTTQDASRRNALALSLAETRQPEVLEVLIELINKPELQDRRGTLVHCLGFFDCSPHFALMADLLINGNWEVAHEASALMNNIEKLHGAQVKSAYEALKIASENNNIEEWRKDLLINLLEFFSC